MFLLNNKSRTSKDIGTNIIHYYLSTYNLIILLLQFKFHSLNIVNIVFSYLFYFDNY